jgi:DNA-binding protein H-NS
MPFDKSETGGTAVQEVINKIIEIDHKAQKMTDDALSMKAQTQADIEKDIKNLHEKYMQRAERRIKVTTDTEQKFLDESLDEIKSKYNNKKAVLNKSYDSNHAQWANEIYNRVIGG